MGPVFQAHRPDIIIDDETWTAFERTAEARRESVGELIAYAIELFMEREGFSPQWALEPTNVALPGEAGAAARVRSKPAPRP